MAQNISPEIRRHIDDYISVLKKEIPISAVYLFGSHAKGNARASSDIDIAVVSPALGIDMHEEGKWLFRKLLEVQYTNFDIVGYSPEYFATGNSPLLDQIRKTAIMVV